MASAATTNGYKNGTDANARIIEALATKMGEPDNVHTFAVDYSILHDEEAVKTMERVNPKYYVLLPAMLFVAFFMMLKVFFYRMAYVPLARVILKKKFSRERMLLGPRKGTIFFDKFDKLANLLRNGVTTSIALDIAYNLPKIRPRLDSIGEYLCDFWLNQPDGYGLRNRVKIIYTNLVDEMSKRLAFADDLKVLCLACGSAQAIIEALRAVKDKYPGKNIEITLVDLNRTSLKMAAFLAESRQVLENLTIKEQNIKDFLDNQPSDVWDMVEMVGFLDYRKDSSVTAISKQIRRVLKPGGIFITSSICPSLWSFAVRWVVNWPLLIRRGKESFKSILTKAWEAGDTVNLRYVPTKTHVVALLIKK